MHMEMENGLSCNFSIILNQIISITSKNFCLMLDHFLGEFRCFTKNFFINLINVCVMLLWQN